VANPDRGIHRLQELTNWFQRYDPAMTADDEDAVAAGETADADEE
jgi:hypothetical protein